MSWPPHLARIPPASFAVRVKGANLRAGKPHSEPTSRLQRGSSRHLGADLKTARSAGFILAVLLFISFDLAFAWSPDDPRFRKPALSAEPKITASETADGLLVSVSVPPLGVRPTAAGPLLTASSCFWLEGPSAAAVPAIGTLVALPRRGQAHCILLSATYDTLSLRWAELAPFAALTDSNSGGSREKNIGGSPDLTPYLSEAGVLRGCRLARLTIPVARPSTGERVLQLREARLLLRIDGLKPIGMGAAADLLQSLRKLVLNPDWLDPAPPQLREPPGQPGRLRIRVADSGLVRIRGSELVSRGIEPREIDPTQVVVVHRDEVLPVLASGLEDGKFDADDTLIFYAQALHGDTSFTYPYSDTNVFWLDWGKERHARWYLPEEALVDRTAPVDSVVVVSLHFERELVYHDGDDDLSIKRTDPVPGEGWIWRRFYPGDEDTVTFVLRDLRREGTGEIRVRVRGVSPPGSSSRLRLELNGRVLGLLEFPNREDRTLEVSFPAAYFREGKNQVRLVSETPPAGAQNQWNLDWLEVSFPRRLVLRGGEVLDVLLPPSSSPRTWAIRTDSPRPPLLLLVDRGVLLRPARADSSHSDSLFISSAGFEDGDRCQILVRGTPVVERGGRGLNVVALDPRTGQVLAARTFDTHRDTTQATALADFIHSLPESCVVLAGIRDEGTAGMTERAYRALESLGSAQIRRLGYRDSWCLIGRKGSSPGSALEAWSLRGHGPAELRTFVLFPEGGPVRYLWTDTLRSAKHLVAADPAAPSAPAQLELDEPANLVGPRSAGAECVVIAPRALHPAAERLLRGKKCSGIVVDVQDVYDEFHYGLKSPEAIREFVTYAFWRWPPPRLRSVLLLGDASWDPRKRSPGAVFEDLVPTYGKPVSDSRLVCVDGPGDLLPDLPVGRIPAQTPQEAEEIVEKLFEYRALRGGRWLKRFLLITGGYDPYEQSLFVRQSTDAAQAFIAPPPAAMRWDLISKKSTGYLEGEGREDILRGINKGVLWVNFIGHAGSHTWDLMFGNRDVDALRNRPYYPFVTSMTCHTARFANPYQESLGERFLLAPKKGAIAFFGTTGWGLAYQDELLLRQLLSVVLRDTVRELGEAIWLAKLRYWASSGNGLLDQTILDQYTLLGDPTADLALAREPDLALTGEDIRILPEEPTAADASIRIRATIWNYGLALAESSDVLFTVRPDNGGEIALGELRLPPVGFVDSLECTWKTPERPGTYLLTVTVDPLAKVPDADRMNNSAEKELVIKGRAVEILWPPPFAELSASDSIALFLAPGQGWKERSHLSIEMDTSSAFQHPLRQLSLPLEGSPPLLRVCLGRLFPATFHCRIRAVRGSEVEAEVLTQFRVVARMSGSGWGQRGSELAFSSGSGFAAGPTGVSLGSRKLRLEVTSAGADDGNFARILVDTISVAQSHPGYNLVVLSPWGATRSRSFPTPLAPVAAESLATFLAGIPTGHHLLIAICGDGATGLTERVLQQLEMLGSRLCRELRYRDSWAFLARIGDPSSVREVLRRRGEGVASLVDSIKVFAERAEIVSPWIGPAGSWHELLLWLAGSGKATVSLFGKASLTGPERLLSTFPCEAPTDSHSLSLEAVDARYLRLTCTILWPDSLWGLRAWAVRLTPPCELEIAQFRPDRTSILTGERVQFTAVVRNLGPGSSPEARAIWQWEDASGESRQADSSFVFPALPPGDSCAVRWSWHPRDGPGCYTIRLRLDPEDRIPELCEWNNEAHLTLAIRPDSVGPGIALFVDGREVIDGDYVPWEADYEIRVQDASQYAAEDSFRIRIAVDGVDVRQLAPGDVEFLPRLEGGAAVQFRLRLEPGRHLLEASAWDLSGNRAELSLFLQVAKGLVLENVMNYPNPFANETAFTYFLSKDVDRVTIRVFTLSGREVWNSSLAPGNAGFNSLSWDGCDRDGDPLANGVYLYSVEARSGTESARVLSKLVIMR
jgi:hypothetical protein